MQLAATDFNLIADVQPRLLRQFASGQNVRRKLLRKVAIILRPRAFNLPPGIYAPNAGSEFLLAIMQRLSEVSTDQFGHRLRHCASEFFVDGKKRRIAFDVVSPENAFDLDEVLLVDKSAFPGRLQVDTANVNVERVFNRSYYEVGAEAAQFLIDLVANVVPTAIIAVAMLMPSAMASSATLLRRFCLRNDSNNNRRNITLRTVQSAAPGQRRKSQRNRHPVPLQRNRVAAAGLAHALRVNGRSAVFADEPGRALIKADAAAYLAGVKD